MSNKAFIEAEQRAQQREAERAAKKDRAQQRAQAASIPSVQGERTDTEPRTCLCHKAEHRPHDSHLCCKAQTDSIRWTGRVAADTDLDDVERVQKIIDSGVIPRAKTKMQLAEEREQRGTASALKAVANANGKPVVVAPKQELPDSVNFADPNQAHYFAKCAVLRGLNFQLAARDAYPLLTPFEHSVVAAVAEKDANIRAAIEQEASQRGLGESDKKIFVGLLWKHALSTQPQNFQDRGTAMRILSKAFIEGQPQQQTPAKIEIVGIESGLKRMFGSDYDKLKDLQQPVTVPDLRDEDFEKAEDE